MKSTELIKLEKVGRSLLERDQKQSVVFNLIYFILGIFISKASVFGEYAPFGVSLVAAAPYKNLLSTLFGTIIGYMLPSEINVSIRYIVAVISISLVRWTLNDLDKIRNSKLYAPFLSGLVILATGMVVNPGETFFNNLFSYNMLEAIFSGVFSYFFRETVLLFNGKRTSLMLNQQELAYAFISFWVIILSFSSVVLGRLSLGRILSNFSILFCSRYLGIAGGSVAGISAAVVLDCLLRLRLIFTGRTLLEGW